jgi:hypothetical protein
LIGFIAYLKKPVKLFLKIFLDKKGGPDYGVFGDCLVEDQKPKREARSVSNLPHPRGQQSPTVRAFSFGSCTKKGFRSEGSAFLYICRALKKYKDLDAACFKVYKCPFCHRFHLAKAKGLRIAEEKV